MRQRCPSLPVELWQAPDNYRWRAARKPAATILDRTKGRAYWSSRYWQDLEEAHSYFLGWLRAEGALDWKVEPAERCTRERLAAYVEFMLRRVRPATTHHRVRHLAIVLEMLGGRLDRSTFAQACQYLRRLERREKRFERPPPVARLKTLGMKLMALAESGSDPRDSVNAVIFRDGLLIAVLAHRPMRRRNWAEFRLDYDLVRRGSDGWNIAPKSRNVKNRKMGPMPWPKELLPALEQYLAAYRPLLLRESTTTDVLWITYRGKPMTPATLSLAVARRTQTEFGRAWRPHAFRRAVAGDTTVPDAAALLGDTPSVVQKNYAPSNRRAALRRHIQVLQGLGD